MNNIKLTVLATLLLTAACNNKKAVVLTSWSAAQPQLVRINTSKPDTYTLEEYYETGQLKRLTLISGSVENGPQLTYRSDGSLESRADYKNGKLNGIEMDFDDNNTIMSKGYFVNGEAMGPTFYYYANGQLHTQFFNRHNRSYMVNSWDSTGTQTLKDGNGVQREDYSSSPEKDLSKKDMGGYILTHYKDSIRNGTRSTYDATTNKLLKEETYRNDSLLSTAWK